MKILKKVSFIIVIGVVLLCSGLLYIRHCEWNPEVAASYATNNAESKSVGLCGLYVRKAIIAGGIPLYWGGNAWSYKYTLPILGFERINKDEKLIIGDIAVFQPIGGRKFGHIAMWNGKQWISDFKQKSIILHSDYKKEECEFEIFRKYGK